MLIKVLLTWKKDSTPELSATQFLPVPVDPTQALPEELGCLLGSQYIAGVRRVNLSLAHWRDLFLSTRFVGARGQVENRGVIRFTQYIGDFLQLDQVYSISFHSSCWPFCENGSSTISKVVHKPEVALGMVF
jgi:hypothetical protein